MNKKQLIQFLHEQRPEPPVGFEARIEAQLAHLTEEEHAMKRKHRVSVAMIAAVLLILLASTALALGYSNLMEYLHLRNIKPLDGTEKLIQTDFGVQPTVADASSSEVPQNPVAYTVEEAVYDGQTVIVQLLVAPTQPEKYALLNTGIQDIPEQMYSGIVYHPNGSADLSNLTRKDGKRIINYSLGLDQADANSDYLFELETLDALELDDGIVRIWLEGSILEGSTDVVELTIHSGYDFYDQLNNADWAGYPYHYEKQIRLETSLRAHTAALTPVSSAKGERFEILDASLTFYPVQGRIAIDYSYLPDKQAEPLGIDFRVYDSENNLIERGSSISSTLLERRENGTEVWRKVEQIQAFDVFPEKVYLEAKVIGKDRTLGKLEFNVKETDASNLNSTSTTSEIIAEKTPVGLIMKPVESWSGERICLLEGSICSGRKVKLSYTYDGERVDGARIVVNYKDTSGSVIGVPLTTLCTVGKDSYTLEDTLDGSGWPLEMILEFELDGTILDVFKCELSQTMQPPITGG